MSIDLDDLLKNTQIRKPVCLNDPENFLKQTPHLPFFLQPFSPAEKVCYQQKSLTFIPTPKQPVKKGFKWDKDVNESQDGFWDKDGKFCVKAKKDILWLLKGSLVPYTTAEMESMRDSGELKGQLIKRVDDQYFIKYDEIERQGGILTDEKTDEIFKALEIEKGGETKTKTNKGESNVTQMLLAMECTVKQSEIIKKINNKTRIDAIAYLERVTKKSKGQCVKLLNAFCSEKKVVLSSAVDEEGFKPVKNITRRK